MSAYAASASAAEPNFTPQSSSSSSSEDKEEYLGNRIKNASASTLGRAMKICNALNAGLIAATGVVAFMILSLSVIIVLSAIYVICFALLLFCFECHFKAFDSMINVNFGFMFRWQGRALFLFFTGTLCFGLGTMGIIIGCITVGNVIFNVYVLYKNPAYRESMKPKELKSKLTVVGVMGSEAASATISTSAPSSSSSSSSSNAYSANDSNPFTVSINASPSAVIAIASTLSSEWEKLYDQGSGKYYYFNSKTNESRWEEDHK